MSCTFLEFIIFPTSQPSIFKRQYNVNIATIIKTRGLKTSTAFTRPKGRDRRLPCFSSIIGFSADEGGSMRSSSPKGLNYWSCVRWQQVFSQQRTCLVWCFLSRYDRNRCKNQELTPVWGCSMFREGGGIAVCGDGPSKVGLGTTLKPFVGLLHITRPRF